MQQMPCFTLTSLQNVYFGYLLESPRWGDSNKYPKHMLLEVLNNNVPAYFLINCYLLRVGFRASLIVSITSVFVVSSVGIIRVDCTIPCLLISVAALKVMHISHNVRKCTFRTCTPSEDSDHSAHLHTLIRIFNVRILDSKGCKISSLGEQRLWSDCVMRRLIWIFAGRTCQLYVFSRSGSYHASLFISPFKIQSTVLILTSLNSYDRLSRSENLVPVLTWSNFSSFPQYFRYVSNFRSQFFIVICKMWCSVYFCLKCANLICRGTNNSNYFRESLGLQNNENRL